MKIYLIRHAQSEFNLVYDANKPDPMIYDAPLTGFGKKQAELARANFEDLGITRVMVSPFTRTLQTASIIFGADYPLEVHAGVREQLSNSCDVGSDPATLSMAYPHLDFSALDSIWWHRGEVDERGISPEPHQVLLDRSVQFFDSLKFDDTQTLAIVTHGNFIHAQTDIHPENCEIFKFDLKSRLGHSIAKI